jgi:hypothetical protein
MTLDTLEIPNLHYGITVSYMLTRMTNEELETLRDGTNEELGDEATVFSDWVSAVVNDELARRHEQTVDIFREPTYPHLPAMRWSGADLGDALVAANILSYSLDDTEPGNFIDKVVMALSAICRSRLSKLT